MNIKRKSNVFLILLLLVCFFSSFVVEAHPFVQTTGEIVPLCDIEAPGPFTWKLNADRDIYFHVVNSSGAPLEDDSISCLVHIYGDEGEHIYENNSVHFDGVYDWEAKVDGELINFKENTLLVQCNSTNYGCFKTYSISATKAGITEEGEGSSLPITLFVLMIPLLLYILPVIVGSFARNRLLDYTIKGACYVLATFFMIQAASVVSTIAEVAGTGLTSGLIGNVELFVYVGIFAFMSLIGVFFFGLTSEIKLAKERKRGYNEEDETS